MADKLISLTFDDGLLDTYQVAFPILERAGVKATAFIVTGAFTGEVNEVLRSDKNPLMSYDQVKELHNADWEIGNHTHTHKLFDSIPIDQVDEEIRQANDLLKEFNPVSFAYPGGHRHYTPESVHLVAKYFKWGRGAFDAPLPNLKPYKKFTLRGIPTDSQPGVKLNIDFDRFGWYILVYHLIRDPRMFELFIQSLLDSSYTFVRLKDVDG